MQFYFYRIDRKVMGTKWSRALALLLRKEEWGLLESLVLEVVGHDGLMLPCSKDRGGVDL
jgi:hypothetical protein